jgi:hypothetical protein
MFDLDYLFVARSNEEQLGKIVKALGYQDLKPYLKKCQLKLTQDEERFIKK